MTKEQREAIDRLEKLVRLRKSKNTIKYDNCICSTEDLDTVLSLIKEQQKEIEEREKALYVEILENHNREELLKVKLKKKDKQIDLMVEHWSAGLAICDECEYIVEAYTKDNCKLCIKQYFEKLAKENKQ